MSTTASYVSRAEAGSATGVVVAIDVLRAFTTAAFAFAGGAEAIWLVADVDEALALGSSIPGALVMGEEHGRRPPGFALSNSPVAVAEAELDGRVLVHRTTAGTRGAVAASSAERLFVSSLVCASATAAAIDATGLGAPTYVITGAFPDDPDSGFDDLVTAQLIERVRTGLPIDAATTAAGVRDSPEAAITLAVGKGHVHPDDIAYAIDVDRFDFAMEAERVDGRLRLRRADAPA